LAFGFSSYIEAQLYYNKHFLESGIDMAIWQKDIVSQRQAEFTKEFKNFIDVDSLRRDKLFAALFAFYNKEYVASSSLFTSLIDAFKEWESED
jgi:hypothetical protein